MPKLTNFMLFLVAASILAAGVLVTMKIPAGTGDQRDSAVITVRVYGEHQGVRYSIDASGEYVRFHEDYQYLTDRAMSGSAAMKEAIGDGRY